MVGLTGFILVVFYNLLDEGFIIILVELFINIVEEIYIAIICNQQSQN